MSQCPWPCWLSPWLTWCGSPSRAAPACPWGTGGACEAPAWREAAEAATPPPRLCQSERPCPRGRRLPALSTQSGNCRDSFPKIIILKCIAFAFLGNRKRMAKHLGCDRLTVAMQVKSQAWSQWDPWDKSTEALSGQRKLTIYLLAPRRLTSLLTLKYKCHFSFHKSTIYIYTYMRCTYYLYPHTLYLLLSFDCTTFISRRSRTPKIHIWYMRMINWPIWSRTPKTMHRIHIFMEWPVTLL